jgi:hypothetical protein
MTASASTAHVYKRVSLTRVVSGVVRPRASGCVFACLRAAVGVQIAGYRCTECDVCICVCVCFICCICCRVYDFNASCVCSRCVLLHVHVREAIGLMV